MTKLAAYQEDLDFDNSDVENAMTCLVFVLIQSPLLLAVAKQAPDNKLFLKLTYALLTIREYRQNLRDFTTIYDNDEDAGLLITALDLPGHSAIQRTISALSPVRAIKDLINLVPDNQWGNNTAACKTYLRNAIEQVYRLDDNRGRTAASEDLNVDKEILQWMFLCGRPPVNPHVLNNHIWFLIKCHWATVCAQRQPVWYLTGFAGRMFNQFWSENKADNVGVEWRYLKVAVINVVAGLGCAIPDRWDAVRADPGR
ncbi:hypothetical protein KCU62_g799, partial [Aureobasidium sp. EXF-3399]